MTKFISSVSSGVHLEQFKFLTENYMRQCGFTKTPDQMLHKWQFYLMGIHVRAWC